MTKILVVEDEHDLREDIVEYLELEGFDVVDACDGEDALVKAAACAPDVIISDISMPRLDGKEFFKKLHADHPDIAEVPFLFLTALTDREAELQGRALGASDYLGKPIDMELLVATIHSHLNATDKVTRKVSRQLQSVLSKASGDKVLSSGKNSKKILDDLLARYQTVMEDSSGQVGSLGVIETASFHFKTLAEAKGAAKILSQSCPDIDGAALGLVELLVNAVEHGNLELSYADKSRLLASGEWSEEVESRLADSVYAERVVHVHFSRAVTEISITITDQGQGFDWEKYMMLDEERALDMHGRGIAFASSISFSSLSYNDKGNQVTAVIDMSVAASPADARALNADF